MATAAKIEITLKITELPAGASKTKNDWTGFTLDAEGQEISLAVRPKMWNKLTQAQADWPQWAASITGRMGPRTAKGFELLEPAIQVFERKPKEAAPSPEAVAA